MSTEYDLATGLVTATIDVNSQKNHFTYNDPPLNRLKEVIRAEADVVVRNKTTYEYDDTTHGAARSFVTKSGEAIFFSGRMKLSSRHTSGRT